MSFALVKYLPTGTEYGFIRLRRMALLVSIALMLGSVGAYFGFGINFGIDFRGGIQLEVMTDEPADELRAVADGLGFGESEIQASRAPAGEVRSVMITLPLQPGEGIEAEQAQQAAGLALREALSASFPGIDLRGDSVIGAAVSGELIQTGIIAIVVALILMLAYILLRFDQPAYSFGAVLALTHDVIATVGLFAITQMTFDLATVAAILTIVGYSMNDTVVVYDRIRENLRKYKKRPLDEVLDLSLNDTLSRTILTSVTTLIALFSLYLIGGSALKGFSLAMIWGVVIGTYSSVFVAVPLLLTLNVARSSDDGEAEGQ